MPQSHQHDLAHSSSMTTPVKIDRVIEAAQAEGIGSNFVVSLPQDEQGVWTIAATTMNKAIRDPRRELTVHIDQHSGATLEIIGWGDYGPGARAMATSVPLHMGSFGWWNQTLSALFCLSFMLLAFSGVRMWWLRRPAVVFHLGAPQRVVGVRVPLVVMLAMLIIAVAFPLTGIVIIAVMMIDFFLVQRVPGFRKVFG
jgi:uncharacterized iron-regulated membrane protein